MQLNLLYLYWSGMRDVCLITGRNRFTDEKTGMKCQYIC